MCGTSVNVSMHTAVRRGGTVRLPVVAVSLPGGLGGSRCWGCAGEMAAKQPQSQK